MENCTIKDALASRIQVIDDKDRVIQTMLSSISIASDGDRTCPDSDSSRNDVSLVKLDLTLGDLTLGHVYPEEELPFGVNEICSQRKIGGEISEHFMTTQEDNLDQEGCDQKAETQSLAIGDTGSNGDVTSLSVYSYSSSGDANNHDLTAFEPLFRILQSAVKGAGEGGEEEGYDKEEDLAKFMHRFQHLKELNKYMYRRVN